MFGALGAAGGALGRCATAMRAHPELVRGAGAIDTELMRAEPGLVAKVGAEATIGVGLRDGRGLALKARDGAWRALEAAAAHVARSELGVDVTGAALEPSMPRRWSSTPAAKSRARSTPASTLLR